ncbi:MAG: glycosyltransferase family 2 protein [Herpetosiphon sp.]
MLLSVIIPCFNEGRTIRDVLRAVRAVTLDKEIIVVDDHSSDDSYLQLQREAEHDDRLHVVRHQRNLGKGAAIRSGLRLARGEIVLIQDADLEYDPQDYYELVRPIVEGKVDVVFGSRFSGRHTGMYFWNAIGNHFLTFVTNFFYNAWLSDMETCYKVMRTPILQSLGLRSRDFRIEAEIAAKVLRQGHRVLEVPISYFGRTYEEGKKIQKIDGLKALGTLLHYRFWAGSRPEIAPIDRSILRAAEDAIRQAARPAYSSRATV